MVSWLAESITHWSSWPVTHTLILEWTAKSSTVNLRFSQFVKIQHLHQQKITQGLISIFFQFFDRSETRLDQAKISLAGRCVCHPLKIILSPAIGKQWTVRHTCNVVYYLTVLILTELDRGLRPFGCRRSRLSYSGSIFEQLLRWLSWQCFE